MRHRADDLRAEIGGDVCELRSRLRETFDLRRQIARHPFVAAAVVLGGVFVAARLAQSLLRGIRTREVKAPRRGRGPESRSIAHAPGRGPGTCEVPLKEARG
jgi:hypothetical protein